MPAARRIATLAVAAYLLVVFIDKFVLIELLVRRTGLAFVAACFVAAACVGAGFVARRRLRGAAINLAVGYPIFGTVCFLIGLMKISIWTMLPVVLILAVVGVISVVPRPSAVTDAGRIAPSASLRAGGAPLSGAPLIAIVLVIVAGFIAAQAPPTSLDELAYHLAVPWSWVKEGRAVDLPLISHSYFPLGVESADLPLLSLLGTDGGIASHFLHLFVAIAAMALIFRGDTLVVAAIVTAPVLAVTAGWSLVDWNLLAVALALLRGVEDDDRATIAAALGAGLLTKYTFIPFAAIVLIASRRWHGLIPGLIGGSVFFIRNAILTGNPVAPFLGADAPHVAHYRAGAYLSDYVFDGRFLDESLGASLLSATVSTAGLTCWLLAGAGLVLFFLAPSARILTPFFAVPASRAVISWKPLRVFIAISIVLQLFLLAFFVQRSAVFRLMTGQDSDEDFVAKVRPSTVSIRAIDAALPPDSRTLVVGLNETFWFEHRVRGGGNFDGPRVSRYLETATPEALRELLRRDGISHVAVIAASPATAVAKKIEERETNLSPGAQRSLAQTLDRYAAAVTRAGDATLFALR